jgi:hypothetical protein
VAKKIFILAALASAVLCLPAVAQTARDSHPDIKASFVGSTLNCSQQERQVETFTVPQPLAKRAKLKARLLNLLHDSLSDDSKGIVNAAREKEITNLARKLKDEKEVFDPGR